MRSLESASQFTAKNIYALQNDELLLKCLCVQREKYTRAKKLLCWKIVFIFYLVCISWLDACCENGKYGSFVKAVLGLSGVVFMMASRLLERAVHTLKKRATQIQLFFDANLYSKVLGGDIEEWGNILTKSEVAEDISLVVGNADAYKNWYSDYASMTPEQQIFYCQKENMRWDFDLRQKFIFRSGVALSLIIALAIIPGLYCNFSIIQCCYALSIGLPLLELIIDQSISLNDDINRLTRIKTKFKDLEPKIEKNTRGIRKHLFELQILINEHRENAFLIPDWFYHCYQSQQNQKEDNIARILSNRKNGLGNDSADV